jgi:GT2 family glycosyltransferase
MISFILCVRDREEQTAHSLPAIFKQAAACGGEAIVVDQDSRPPAAARLRAACKSSGAAYIRLDRGGPFNRSWALNVGARAASMPLLSFCDADVVVDDGYAAAVARKHRDIFRSGPCIINCMPFLVSERLSAIFRESGDVGLLRGREHEWWWTLGVGCHVDAGSFRAVGGFDEGYDGWGCEDDDLFRRLRARGCGWAIATPVARGWHLWHPPTPGRGDHEPPNRRRLARSVERVAKGDIVRNARRDWGSRAWVPLDGDDGN